MGGLVVKKKVSLFSDSGTEEKRGGRQKKKRGEKKEIDHSNLTILLHNHSIIP